MKKKKGVSRGKRDRIATLPPSKTIIEQVMLAHKAAVEEYVMDEILKEFDEEE